MSLDLAELVSVTNNVVRSLEKSQSSSGSERIRPKEFRFDNNSDSPRSLRSASEAKEAHIHGFDNGSGTSSAAILTINPKQGTHSTDLECKENYLVGNDRQNCQAYENNDEISKTEQGCKPSIEQNESILERSKDLSTVNQQETTTSDNYLGSSQGSRLSAKELKTNAINPPQQHKAIHLNVSRNRPDRHKKEEMHGENLRDNSCMYDDPEIIDVPEHVIAIRSGMSSASEESVCNEINTVLEANLPQNRSKQHFGIKSFGKVSSSFMYCFSCSKKFTCSPHSHTHTLIC